MSRKTTNARTGDYIHCLLLIVVVVVVVVFAVVVVAAAVVVVVVVATRCGTVSATIASVACSKKYKKKQRRSL